MTSQEINSTSTEIERLTKCIGYLNEVKRKHYNYIKVRYKLNALEMEIIQWLVMEGKKKMKEIGEQFDIKLSSLTSVIDKIEKQKFVYRKNSKDDRRVVFLDATERGTKVYQEYKDYLKVVSFLLRKEMDETHFEAFIKGVDKMLEYQPELLE